jgi:signal transduction histidine kinase
MTHMRVRLLFLFLLLAACLELGAQTTLPPVVKMLDDTLRGYELKDSQLLYLEDPSGKLTLGEVKDRYRRGQMGAMNPKKQGKNLSTVVHWFYYRIVNNMSLQTEAAVLGRADYADIFVVRTSGTTDSLRTGSLIPWSKKKEFKEHNVVTFSLMPGDSVEVFQRMEFKKKRRDLLALAVLKPEKYARKRLADLEPASVPKSRVPATAFSTFVIIMGLIYLVFYRLVKEKVFLYFGLFLLFLSSNVFNVMYGVMREYPMLEGKSQVLSQVSFFFFIQFYREYLQTRIHTPRWDKLLHVFAYIFIGVVLTNSIFLPEQMLPLTIVVSLLPPLLIATHFLMPGKMLREKRFLAYTTLPLLILFILFIAIAFSGARIEDEFIEIVFLVMFVWMIMAFTSILVRRFMEQRKRIQEHEQEKENLKKERELERLKQAEQQKIALEKEVEERTSELKQSLENLKATQSQLIQSEKMASLGEMTAGIAHEIQNPLNFVNNFAEVNMEMADELAELLRSGQTDQATALLEDLKNNQEKIRTHGKRAEGIVKNMLQHSRTGTLQKESAAVNPLVEEFTKLSYHGLRAKDKSFNSDIEIILDPNVGNANLLTQDIGRVILNLVNNAFYAVHERFKTGHTGFQPKVTVTTSRGETIRIVVSDNGKGIPENIRSKIFQPFFTTKPTGEGTGLGLSLSYEIITKGHGGNMKVESKEGEGTSFIIEIPA